MYKINLNPQEAFSNFNQSAGMQLDPDNDWVVRAELIPWENLEQKYAEQFPSHTGNVAKPFRMVLGSLIIQKKKNLSDRMLVKELKENPYLQYFIGLPGFQHKVPFTAPLLVTFRKRLNVMFLSEVNEELLDAIEKVEDLTDKKKGKKKSLPIKDETENVGTEILDATCAPSKIRYPLDYSLLNEARTKLEMMIDWFYQSYGFSQKPRTYRRIAKKEYVALAKTKKPGTKKIRATIRKQLGYVKRDIRYLDEYMKQGYAMKPEYIDMYLTILKLYEQQKYMFDNKTHRVEDRIVSISQPYIRPIVRGKVNAPVEFGAKFDISIDERGHARMEKISFDPYNESMIFMDALERYKERTGHYPERVLVDQIYRTRANRVFCKEKGVRMSGPKLGRPPKEKPKTTKTEYKDNADRGEVERFFSLAKRCSGMGIITTKLEETTMTSIALGIIVTNLFAVPVEHFFWLYFSGDMPDTDTLYLVEFEDAC